MALKLMAEWAGEGSVDYAGLAQFLRPYGPEVECFPIPSLSIFSPSSASSDAHQATSKVEELKELSLGMRQKEHAPPLSAIKEDPSPSWREQKKETKDALGILVASPHYGERAAQGLYEILQLLHQAGWVFYDMHSGNALYPHDFERCASSVLAHFAPLPSSK